MNLDPRTVHGRLEHAVLRWLFAATVLLALATTPLSGGEPAFPKGIAAFVDLAFLASPAVYWTLLALAAVAAGLYATGRSYLPPLVYLFCLSVGVFTLAMSYGQKTRHDTNVIPLVLLGQIIGHAHWRIAARRRDAAITFAPRGREDLAVYYGCQMLAAMYVLSGISKLVKTGGEWVEDSPLIALQIVRTQHCDYFSRLVPADGLRYWFDFGNFLIEHEWLARAMFAATLLIELGAFAALLGRIPSLLIGLALIGFHLSVLALMNINFYLNVIVLAIYFVDVPHWILRRLAPAAAVAGSARTP